MRKLNYLTLTYEKEVYIKEVILMPEVEEPPPRTTLLCENIMRL
jgi:hypothetical protein